MLTRKEIRSLFKPGDRVMYGVVWLTNDEPKRRVQLKGTFHSWDEGFRAAPFLCFVELDQPEPPSGKTFVNVDYRTLTLINALERLAEET